MSLTLKIRHTSGADENIPIPKYATIGSSGADLRANFPESIRNFGKILMPGCRSLIPTGLMMEIPEGHEVQIRPRSGLAIKNGVTVLNSPGTIDCDYRGEVAVILINSGDQEFKISHGDRIAQMVVAEVVQMKFLLSKDLAETERGVTGFGSTGID